MRYITPGKRSKETNMMRAYEETEVEKGSRRAPGENKEINKETKRVLCAGSATEND